MKDYHSVHNLNYHLVIVVKYRRAVINDQISQELKNIFSRIADKHGITIQEWNHDKDHIHVLFSATPATHLSKFLNSYKSASSRVIKSSFPDVREKLWEEKFWSRSYYLSTVGDNTIDIISDYVRSQGDDQ